MKRLFFAMLLCAPCGLAAAWPSWDPHAGPALPTESESAPGTEKRTNRERESPGAFALSFFCSPMLRFRESPGAIMGGGGVSADWRPVNLFALSLGASAWGGWVYHSPDQRFGRGPERQTKVGSFEVTAAPRFYPHLWRTGSLYGEVRFNYSVADGPDPLLRTQCWGVDFAFGVEFGLRPWFAFVELAIGQRVALGRTQDGWIPTSQSTNAESGTLFDLTRIGLRWYF